jgi:hypothetical protein
VVLDWNEVALATIQRELAPPPVAAWVLATTHIAIHDTVNSIEPRHNSFRVFVPCSSDTSREAAAAQAAFRVLHQFYPAERARLEFALATSLAQAPDGPGKTAGISLGNIVAERVIDWRRSDGSQRIVAYSPGTQPGQWRPTPPDFQRAMLPCWAYVTPFGIAYASQFRNAFPPTLDSAEYAAAFEEVKLLGSINSRVRTAEQTQIAHFWADGPGTVTPAGHWNRIAQTVSRSAGLTMHENARLLALLNVAMADGAIVCWDGKYAFNFWRPVSAIHEADTDGNQRTRSDRGWWPLLNTPPFPSYTSGHSTFSGAAAQTLTLFFGRDDVRFSDTSGAARISRTFTSFSQAAEEAGRSRIYGGIHFEFDNRGGLQSGRAVGQYIFDNYLKPISIPSDVGVATLAAYPSTSNETGGDLIFAQYVVVPILCHEPEVYEYHPDVAIAQPVETYFVFPEW